MSKLQQDKPRRRDHFCIVADILAIAKAGILKTQIMYRANLSFTQLNEYIPYLLQKRLLIQSVIAGKETYKTTPKGHDFLRIHRDLTKLLLQDGMAKDKVLIM